MARKTTAPNIANAVGNNPLMEALANRSDSRPITRKSPWADRMAAEDPKAYDDLRQIAEDFLGGGEAARKLMSIQGLYDFLSDAGAFPAPMAYCTFRKWLGGLKD